MLNARCSMGRGWNYELNEESNNEPNDEPNSENELPN